MKNTDTADNIQIDRTKVEKVTSYDYLRQTTETVKQNKKRTLERRKSPPFQSKKKSLQPVYLTNYDIQMPHMISKKNNSTEV